MELGKYLFSEFQTKLTASCFIKTLKSIENGLKLFFFFQILWNEAEF